VLAGTEGAVSPFWSPDSRSIGFFADSKLKRLDLGGGSPLTMTNVSVLPRGATWSSDGVILFAPSASGSLYRVPASGGDVVAVTRLQPQHTSHRFPQFLPRTRQFLFYVQGATDIQGIYLGSLDSQDTKRLTSSETMGAYVPYGWLLFVRQGTLVARRFDPMRRELTSDPVTVADRVGFESSVNIVALSVANAGPITYRATGAIARQLNWFDRSGRLLGQFGARDENELTNPELSPDARRVAVNRTVQGNIDVFLMDSIRPNRLTFDAAIDGYPVWSPDGDRVAFRTNRKGIFDLFETSPGITGSDSPLVESSQTKIPTSWSRDGRFVLYYTVDPMTARDIWLLARDGDRKPFPFLNTRFDEFNGQFSHDGRWVAYESNESGQSEIYVRPFPVRAGQVQISTSGGFSARWRPDGKELYYVATDGMLMAVPITVSGATLEPGKPVPLFRPRMVTTTVSSRQQYDVTADGRFLINVTSDDATASPITVLQNWKPPVK
jgi:Tol biopolymer transport system component